MNNASSDVLYIDWNWRVTIRRLSIFAVIGLALYLVKEITRAFNPPDEIILFEGKEFSVPVDVWWVYSWERAWEVWLVLLAIVAIYFLLLGLIAYVLWWKKTKSQYTSKASKRVSFNMSQISNQEITEFLGENEPTDLLGVNVAATGFSTREYVNSLGQTKIGPSVTLVLLDSDVDLTVGEGSAVTLGENVWNVKKVTIKPTIETMVGNYSSSRVEMVTGPTEETATDPSIHSTRMTPPIHTTNPGASSTAGLIYNLAILLALALIVYIYGIAFDDFSETELVQATLLWYLPLVFGIYGRTATKLSHALNRGIEIKKQLFHVSLLVRYTGMIGITFFFPFLVCRKGPPVKIALVGSAIWLVLLELFFLVLWPSL